MLRGGWGGGEGLERRWGGGGEGPMPLLPPAVSMHIVYLIPGGGGLNVTPATAF